ncbi:hypothetical protein [Mucilaginibacter sp. CSA2-8R]|uniref:hypothetical protein n=1 Tax=Mucilaginibacter sp. CSA2-8R TaxID=3141542 RepID=UPI00315C5E3A
MFHIFKIYFVPASVLIPLAIGLLRYKALNKSYRFLIAFLSFSALSSMIARVFAYVYHNNLIIIQSYTVGEFLFLSGFYYRQFNSLILKRIITAFVLLFVPFASYFIIHYADKIHYDDYGASIETLLIILLGIILINNNSSSSQKSESWALNPTNWFNTGILLYFSGSMFLFLFANINVDGNSLIYNITSIMHATLLTLLSVLFTVGFLKIKNGQ